MTATNPALPTGLDQEQLQQLHRVHLGIASEVKRVCEDHGIDYFLMAGTLLGAVRHGGFIPWDDDLDIGMTRASFDRFLEVAPGNLGGNYFLQTFESDPGYGHCFAKVRLDGTELVEISTSRASAHNGIFVDIFPFDSLPDQAWKRRLHAAVIYALKRVVMLNRGYEPWVEAGRVESWVYRMAAPPSRVLPQMPLARLLNKTVRLFDGEPTRLVSALGGPYGYLKESIEREWTEHLEPIDFEGVPFMCLKNSRAYLTSLYGDYMTPPPPERRVTKHGVTSVDFGGAAA